MSDVLTIGETMAVFVPAVNGAIQYVHDFHLCHAGAESNTAIGLCKLGHSASWFSRLGNDELGQFILSSIRSEGVNVSHVIMDKANPTGLMIKSFKHSQDTEIFYYRKNSAASFLCCDDFPPHLLNSCKILHLTGITPVLSPSCKELVMSIITKARSTGVKISFDPNIRKKLWENIDYSKTILELISLSDIIFMGLDEGEILYHTRKPEELRKLLFSSENLKYLGLKNGSEGAYVYSQTEGIFIPPYPCHCIDPVGAGDAFNAGFLSGLLDGLSLETCGQTAAIAGALCTETNGDIEGIPNKEELRYLLNNQSVTFR